MPPQEYRIIDKTALLHKYLDEGWPEKLAPYPCTQWPCGRRKTGKKWANGTDIMALLFEYRNTDGSINTVVRQLRDGDILYYVE
jgi:hypothetical protein